MAIPPRSGSKVKVLRPKGAVAAIRPPGNGADSAVRLRRFAATARQPSPVGKLAGLPSRSSPEGRAKAGGPDRDRTGDLLNAIQARSQLRYRPIRSLMEPPIVTCHSRTGPKDRFEVEQLARFKRRRRQLLLVPSHQAGGSSTRRIRPYNCPVACGRAGTQHRRCQT